VSALAAPAAQNSLLIEWLSDGADIFDAQMRRYLLRLSLSDDPFDKAGTQNQWK
jgi:hypothetical protein